MGIKLTTEQFKARLESLNPSIEVLGDYQGARKGILCRCRTCGLVWSPTPDNLSRRPRCPKCMGKYRRTTEAFIRDLERINPQVKVIGSFTNTASPVEVQCTVCGYKWSPQANGLLRGSSCPNCMNNKRSKRLAMPMREFLERVNKHNPNVIVLGSYVNSKSRIECKCSICGFEWAPAAGSLLQGYGCPSCAGNMRKNHTQFVCELRGVLPDIEVLGMYQNAHTKILCRCKNCGNTWESKPNNLLNGEGCGACAQTRRTLLQTKTHEEFVSEMAAKSPSIEIVGRYTNAHTRVGCRCRLCGNEWAPFPFDLLNGSGCPECCHTSTSFVEQAILHSFRKAVGDEKVLSRDRSYGVELDILVPDYSLAIEPGAWIWHSERLESDAEKRRQCVSRGIRLVTIYDSYPFEMSPFDSDCFVYRCDLASEDGHGTLRELIGLLFEESGIDYRLSDEEWAAIENQAYIKSRKMTTDAFVGLLATKNPKIAVTGSFKSMSSGIACKCKACGYEWSPTASHLLRGQGCPKCAGRMRKTQQEFERDLNEVSPTLTVLGEYRNSSTPLLVKCNLCGHEWKPRPSNLLSGCGCPICANKRNSMGRRLTHDQFLERMAVRGNPNTEVLGEYLNAKTKLLCRCRQCGYKWMATPNTLLQGHGCKKCADLATGKTVKARFERAQ